MRLDEQRKLETAGRIMASSRNVNEVLAKIAQQAFYLSIVDREKGFTSIWLFGESNLREKAPILPGQLVTTGRHVTTYPLDKEPEAISKVKSLEEFENKRVGIIGRALQTGESQLVENVAKDPDYVSSDGKTRSEIAIPIKIGQRVFGVINVEYYEYATFTEKTKYDMESLAAKAALAIEYVLEHEDLERRISANARYATIIKDEVTTLHRELDKGAKADSIKQRLNSIDKIAERIRNTWD